MHLTIGLQNVIIITIKKKPVTVLKGKIDMPTVTVSLTALLVIDKTPGSQQ